MKPNFFILGAMKAGSTSLHHYLSQHPDVYMSEPKEPRFFSRDEEYERGPDFYWNKYFRRWRGQRAIGEADPDNLFLPYVPQRLKQNLPAAKLVIILRNPVDRAYSHWWMDFSFGIEKLSFEEAISENLKQMEPGFPFQGEEGPRLYREYLYLRSKGTLTYRLYLDPGYYAQHLSRCLSLFPESQVKIVFLEDLERDPQSVVQRVWSFLGVDAGVTLTKTTPQNSPFNNTALSQFYWQLTRIISATRIPKLLPVRYSSVLWTRLWAPVAKLGNRPKMSHAMRSHLSRHYHKQNQELEKLVGRNLSHWNRASTARDGAR